MAIMSDVARVFANDGMLSTVVRYVQKLGKDAKIFINKLWLAFQIGVNLNMPGRTIYEGC